MPPGQETSSPGCTDESIDRTPCNYVKRQGPSGHKFSLRAPTRNNALSYDVRFHPMDAVLRPRHAQKRRRLQLATGESSIDFASNKENVPSKGRTNKRPSLSKQTSSSRVSVRDSISHEAFDADDSPSLPSVGLDSLRLHPGTYKSAKLKHHEQRARISATDHNEYFKQYEQAWHDLAAAEVPSERYERLAQRYQSAWSAWGGQTPWSISSVTSCSQRSKEIDHTIGTVRAFQTGAFASRAGDTANVEIDTDGSNPEDNAVVDGCPSHLGSGTAHLSKPLQIPSATDDSVGPHNREPRYCPWDQTISTSSIANASSRIWCAINTHNRAPYDRSVLDGEDGEGASECLAECADLQQLDRSFPFDQFEEASRKLAEDSMQAMPEWPILAD